MESFRSMIGMKPKSTTTDEEIFVEEIMLLLKPHLEQVKLELLQEQRVTYGDDLTESEGWTEEEIMQRLLKKFFVLAKTDSGLNKFMIPIMMYLRSARMKRGVR